MSDPTDYVFLFVLIGFIVVLGLVITGMFLN